MKNPTGGKIRNDAMGQGYYGASRGHRKHAGTDYECIPGQMVYAPICGLIKRRVQVYKGESKWVGIEIVSKRMTIKLFYVTIDPIRIGTTVKCGEVVGLAQDISEKYGSAMTPHVHLEIVKLDPECLMGV